MSFPQLPFCALRSRRISKAFSELNLTLLSSAGAVDLVRGASSSFAVNAVESLARVVEVKQAESILPIQSLGSEAILSEVKSGVASIPLSIVGSNTSIARESSLDPDLVTYKTAYTSAGSSFASGEELALNTMIESLKASGVWAKLGFLWVCPKSPSNTGSGAIYLKLYGSINAFTLSGFTLGDFDANGLMGDGSSKWADTNIPTNGLVSSAGGTFGAYCHTLAGSNSGYALGTTVDPNNTFLLFPNSATFGAYWELGVRTNTVVSTATTTKGLTIGTLSTTESTLYRDKTLLATRSVSSNSTTVPSINLRAWTRNINNNPPSEFSPYRYSLLFAYDKAFMPTTERDALYDAYAAYCSSIGRSL